MLRSPNMKKQKTHVVTYEAAHNRAVRQFKKMSMFILWSGVLNIVSAIVAVLRTGAMDISLSYAFNEMLFRLLIEHTALSNVWLGISIVGIAAVSGIAFAVLGIFANMGNRLSLLLAAALYFIDFILIFIFIPYGESYWTMIVVHIMFMFAAFAAVVTYYQVLAIEKKFHKV